LITAPSSRGSGLLAPRLLEQRLVLVPRDALLLQQDVEDPLDHRAVRAEGRGAGGSADLVRRRDASEREARREEGRRGEPRPPAGECKKGTHRMKLLGGWKGWAPPWTLVMSRRDP
jgi:hypothetical protein